VQETRERRVGWPRSASRWRQPRGGLLRAEGRAARRTASLQLDEDRLLADAGPEKTDDVRDGQRGVDPGAPRHATRRRAATLLPTVTPRSGPHSIVPRKQEADEAVVHGVGLVVLQPVRGGLEELEAASLHRATLGSAISRPRNGRARPTGRGSGRPRGAGGPSGRRAEGGAYQFTIADDVPAPPDLPRAREEVAAHDRRVRHRLPDAASTTWSRSPFVRTRRSVPPRGRPRREASTCVATRAATLPA